MPVRVNMPGQLAVGDYFESCSFHPCGVVSVDPTGVHIEGISLVDGAVNRCNIRHCGLRALSEQEAGKWKAEGPGDVDLPQRDRWW